VLKIGSRTVDRVKKKFAEQGFKAALENSPATREYMKGKQTGTQKPVR